MLTNINSYYDECYKKKMNIKKLNHNCVKYKNHRKTYLNRTFILTCKLAENIRSNFIKTVVYGRKNKVLVFIHKAKIEGVLIFRKNMNNKERKRYIIFIIAINKDSRNCGYGTSILNKFTEIINSKKKTEIILHSLNSCILFYKKYGFFEINKNNFLEKYEGHENEEKKEDFILLKYICK